jgi:hypothetical protein
MPEPLKITEAVLEKTSAPGRWQGKPVLLPVLDAEGNPNGIARGITWTDHPGRGLARYEVSENKTLKVRNSS